MFKRGVEKLSTFFNEHLLIEIKLSTCFALSLTNHRFLYSYNERNNDTIGEFCLL